MTTILPIQTPLPENKITISPSQYSQWNECEFSWHLSRVEKLRRKETKNYFEVGNGVHDLMHIYYQVVQQGLVPGSYEAQSFMKDRISELLDDISEKDLGADVSKIDVISQITKAMLGFLTKQSPTIDVGITPVGIEYELFVDMGITIADRPVFAHGFVDLLYTRRGLPGVWLRDHKTGANPGTHSQRKVEANGQLLFYNAWLDEAGVDISNVEISFIHTNPPKDPKNHFGYYTHSHNKHALATYRDQVRESVLEMFDPRPKKRKRTDACTSCSFWDICRHEVRGQSTNGIRQQYYSTETKPSSHLSIIS